MIAAAAITAISILAGASMLRSSSPPTRLAGRDGISVVTQPEHRRRVSGESNFGVSTQPVSTRPDPQAETGLDQEEAISDGYRDLAERNRFEQALGSMFSKFRDGGSREMAEATGRKLIQMTRDWELGDSLTREEEQSARFKSKSPFVCGYSGQDFDFYVAGWVPKKPRIIALRFREKGQVWLANGRLQAGTGFEIFEIEGHKIVEITTILPELSEAYSPKITAILDVSRQHSGEGRPIVFQFPEMVCGLTD